MKWPVELTLIRHGESEFNALVSVVLGFSSAQRGEMKPLFWIGSHAAKL